MSRHLVATALLILGLILMGTRPVPWIWWSDRGNVLGLTLALAGALLLAIYLPPSKHPDSKNRRTGWAWGWPRFLVGLWLLLSAGRCSTRYVDYAAFTMHMLPAQLAVTFGLPGDTELAAAYLAVGLGCCIAAMRTVAASGRRGWLGMLALLLLSISWYLSMPVLQ